MTDEIEDATEPGVVIEDSEHWAKVPEALAYDLEISDKAVRVFICLYRHGADPDSCYPSDERIAECIGGSPRSVARPRLDLLERGWIRRFPRRTAGGMRAANGYAIALDPARAKRNAAAFARGDEPAALKRGRLAARATSAQESANATSAQSCAAGTRSTARQASAAQREEREPVKESQRKREPRAATSSEKQTGSAIGAPDGAGGKSSNVLDLSSSPPPVLTKRPPPRSRARPMASDPAPPPSNHGDASEIAGRIWEAHPVRKAAYRKALVRAVAELLTAGRTPAEIEQAAGAARHWTFNGLQHVMGATEAPRFPSAAERQRARNDASLDRVLEVVREATGEPDPFAPTPTEVRAVASAIDTKEIVR